MPAALLYVPCCGARRISSARTPSSPAVRLRCPAKTSPDGAGSFFADRYTHCASASSAAGGAEARGRCHSLRSLYPPQAALPSLPLRHVIYDRRGRVSRPVQSVVAQIKRATLRGGSFLLVREWRAGRPRPYGDEGVVCGTGNPSPTRGVEGCS